MSWFLVLAPLIFVVIAYLGGKSAGRKEAELEYAKKEQTQSQDTDDIISNNINLTSDEFDTWLQNHSKK